MTDNYHIELLAERGATVFGSNWFSNLNLAYYARMQDSNAMHRYYFHLLGQVFLTSARDQK